MLQHPSVSQPRPLGRGDGIKSQIQKKSAGCLIILPHLSPFPRDGAIVSNPKSKKKSAGCLIILPHLSPFPRDGAIVSNPKSKKNRQNASASFHISAPSLGTGRWYVSNPKSKKNRQNASASFHISAPSLGTGRCDVMCILGPFMRIHIVYTILSIQLIQKS